jgi:hypothetical protein
MSRRGWPGVAAGLVAAAAELVGCGASQQRTAPLVIDESAGRVGQIALGEALADVISRAGPPDEDSRFSGFAPAGKLPSDIGANGGFFSTPAGPRGAWPEIFRYKHLAAMFVQDRVFAMVTDDAGARTRGGVGVGDPLSAVRAAYRKAAKCVPESSGGEFRSPAHCAVSVPAGHLSFGDDPIKSIQLIAGPRYTGDHLMPSTCDTMTVRSSPVSSAPRAATAVPSTCSASATRRTATRSRSSRTPSSSTRPGIQSPSSWHHTSRGVGGRS